MKPSKFSDAQKAFIVKQGEDGTPVAEICRKAGISQATYFNWLSARLARPSAPASMHPNSGLSANLLAAEAIATAARSSLSCQSP